MFLTHFIFVITGFFLRTVFNQPSTQEAEVEMPTWTMTNNISKTIENIKNAESFAVYNGALSFVQDKKLHISDVLYDFDYKKIQNFIEYENDYFICPGDEKGKLVYIPKGGNQEIIELPFSDSDDIVYTLKCAHHQKNNLLIVGFIGHTNIYAFNYKEKKWIQTPLVKNDTRSIKAMGLFDDNIIYLYTEEPERHIFVQSVSIKSPLPTDDTEDIFNAPERTLNSSVEWEEDSSLECGFFRGIGNEKQPLLKTYCFVKNNSGNLDFLVLIYEGNGIYRPDPLQQNNDFSKFFSKENDGHFLVGNSISGSTQFTFYFKNEERLNWGVVDLESYLLIFNSEENINGLSIYPINNMNKEGRSFMIKQNNKYKIICTSNSDSTKILQCPLCTDGKKLIIDSIMGNQCFTIPDSQDSKFWKYNLGYYKCANQTHLEKSGQGCVECDDGDSIDSNDGSCKENCTNSEIIGKTCKNCRDYNEYYESSTKKCQPVPDGFYVDEDNNKRQCQETCKTCKNGTACETCKDGYGQTDKGKLCATCYLTCTSCDVVGTKDDQKCTGCIEDHVLKSGNCVHKCKAAGKYYDSITCLDQCPFDSLVDEEEK